MIKRIGIVAAEPSGDQLAALLMKAMIKQQTGLKFEGIAGEKMQSVGCESFYPMEKLSVMGLVEVLKHLPELLKIRKSLYKHWQQNPPDLFIGVDAPDFNLALEQKLKKNGVPTVQYVCPTVWAWRQNRVKKIRRAASLVLSIYPFEVPFLKKFDITSLYAGHPLVQKMADYPDAATSRELLGLQSADQVLAILPGSRLSEIRSLLSDFLQTAVLLSREFKQLKILIPAATQRIKNLIDESLAEYPQLKVQLLDKQSDQALAAADVVLVASGTAALETMLHRRPMVVAYKVHWFTAFLLFKVGMLKTPYISMPNILAGEAIVPELYQSQCQPEKLASALANYLRNPEKSRALQQRFDQLINELSGGNIDDAASALLKLSERSS